MPTNSNYLSVVRGFAGGTAFYEAETPGLPGAANFFASALFKKTAVNGTGLEVLWANLDGNNHGWALYIQNDTALVAQASDGAPSVKVVAVDITPYFGTLILATLSVTAGTLFLYVQGELVGSIALDGGSFVPAAGSKATVGVGTPAHTNPAATCQVAGVGYSETALTQGGQITLFQAAQDAVDLEGAGIFGSGFDFRNRWSAQDLNQGSVTPRATWEPRVGALNLIRTNAGLLSTIGYKNPVWYACMRSASPGPDDSPLRIFGKAGLYTWVRADASDSPASLATDLSGNGIPLTQAVAGSRPIVVTGVAGMPAWSTDGVDDSLNSVAAGLSVPLLVKPAFFVVASMDAACANNARCLSLQQMASGLNTVSILIRRDADLHLASQTTLVTDFATPGRAFSPLANTNTGAHIHIFDVDTFWQMTSDGVVGTTPSAQSGAFTQVSDSLYLGAAAGGFIPFKGLIYDMWIAKAAPSAAQLARVGNYVAARYGIPSS